MLFLPTIFFALPLARAADIYVSHIGNAAPDGSQAKPFGDIQRAVNISRPGDSIILRGGTYNLLKNINITVNGTAAARITLKAAKNEVVIIDGEDLPDTPAPLGGALLNRNRGVIHIARVQYWSFAQLTFINGAYGVYVRDSSNLRFNEIVTRDNYESGFHMQGALSNNVISYLDSYGNRDPRRSGENADGLAIKEGKGEGNIVTGARLWDNSDDGLDLWEFHSKVIIKDSITWGNGYNRWGISNFTGNGNGFKLGGGSPGDIVYSDRDVMNCIAFGNKKHGFTDNSQNGTFAIEGNTSWMNAGKGFRSVNATSVFKRNIAALNDPVAAAKVNASYGGQVTLDADQISTGNSWDYAGPVLTNASAVLTNASAALTNASFKSVDVSLVKGPRVKGGKIVPSDFLVLVDGSKMGATTNWK